MPGQQTAPLAEQTRALFPAVLPGPATDHPCPRPHVQPLCFQVPVPRPEDPEGSSPREQSLVPGRGSALTCAWRTGRGQERVERTLQHVFQCQSAHENSRDSVFNRVCPTAVHGCVRLHIRERAMTQVHFRVPGDEPVSGRPYTHLARGPPGEDLGAALLGGGAQEAAGGRGWNAQARAGWGDRALGATGLLGKDGILGMSLRGRRRKRMDNCQASDAHGGACGRTFTEPRTTANSARQRRAQAGRRHRGGVVAAGGLFQT